MSETFVETKIGMSDGGNTSNNPAMIIIMIL